MNVYSVLVDGESRLYAAQTMTRAIDLAFRTMCEGDGIEPNDEERREFECSSLESAALCGELENVLLLDLEAPLVGLSEAHIIVDAAPG